MARAEVDLAGERRVLDLFETVLDWSEDTRDQRLAELLQHDPGSLAKVRALLRAYAAQPLIETVPPDWDPAAFEIEPPERIGPYRVLEELGRGGMGVVYRAARDDGLFEQDVAIKLVRRSLFSAHARAQFASERRILARLHHPHVGQLFDAGVLEGGDPYIVMELIEGVPITEAADRRGLDVAGRLDLFAQTCEAVDFAHRNLIVHADIKPGNIVVADAFGVKLLDFGIADLLTAPGDEAPAGPRAMTPGYASPALAAGERPAIADDVFSLGVLLRELLGPCAPLEPDLAAVAEKAAASSPAARYPAVRELTADLAAWRAGRPVSARPAGRARRLAMFWRRHRWAVSSAAGAAVALIAVAVVTSTLYLRAEQRFRQTRDLTRYMLNEVTADLQGLPGSSATRQAIAERAQTALVEMGRVPGASRALRLDDAIAFERVGETLADIDARRPTDARRAEAPLARAAFELRRLAAADPSAVAPRLALAQTLVVQSRLAVQSDNRRPQALRDLDEAQALVDAMLANRPDAEAPLTLRWAIDLARGDILDREGEFRALDTLMRARLAHLPRTSSRGPVDARLKTEQTFSLLADARYYLGDKAGALAAYGRGAAALDGAPAPDARVVYRQAYAAFNAASTLAELGRREEALRWIERGVAQAARLRSFEDSPRARHMQNIVTLEHAQELAAVGRLPEAVAAARESVAGRKQRLVWQPDSFEAARAVPVGLRPAAEVYRKAGLDAEACATVLEAQADWAALARRYPMTAFDQTDETRQVAALRDRWGCPPHAAGER